MVSFETYIIKRLPLVSLLCAIFIIYPNIVCIPLELNKSEGNYLGFFCYFIYRFLFFWVFTCFLIRYNLKQIPIAPFRKRLTHNLLIMLVAYLIYISISFGISSSGVRTDFFWSILLFQFFVTCFLCTFMGHICMLHSEQREKDKEIEQLKTENIQSRYNALMSQINPHFLFNSLSGLVSLIRKKNDEITITYVNKMSDVFRYILQSDKKGFVTLDEELEFIDGFFYMMDARFADKLEVNIMVDDEMKLKRLPVLSILPLIENVVSHNQIDSEHRMLVSIWVHDGKELVVSNTLYPRPTPQETNGTGLKNLNNRFSLLMNKEIRTENTGDIFYVYLPLI